MINKHIYHSISKNIDEDKELLAQFEDRYGLSNYNDDEKMILIGKLTSESILERNRVPFAAKKMINEIILENISLVIPKIDNNPRMLSQRGLFTKTSTNFSIEELVENTNYISDETVLYKFIIPDSLSYDIKEKLNNMNINELSLFPDLEGTAKYCNYKLLKEASLSIEEVDRLNIDNIWI